MRKTAVTAFCIQAIVLATACRSWTRPREATPPDLVPALTMLRSADREVRQNGQLEVMRVGNAPERKASAVRALIALLEERASIPGPGTTRQRSWSRSTMPRRSGFSPVTSTTAKASPTFPTADSRSPGGWHRLENPPSPT